ncbi:hypothetical protein BGZ57DRAFT_95902 [Hyaloscypha finlandica]|nr:hypothetical protein BGZ57DRAFT_95902 [Hyaloscypha finlandica]
MAEAFAALSIAANIAQFLDYARQLISHSKEIYSSLSGSLDEHQDLKLIIADIKNLAQESQPASSIRPLDADKLGFRKLAAECEPLADKLLGILKDLEVPNDARFRRVQAVRQTFRGVAKKKDIQDLQRRIAGIDVRLRERASRMLQNTHYSGITSAIISLTQTNERLKMNTDLNLEKMKLELISTLDRGRDEAARQQQAGFDMLSKQLFSLVEGGQLVAQQQTILQTLLFEEMEQREEAIKDAHKTTLDWMFERNETQFMNWLETGNGIYWVKGKAGSGKSTLMKYVSNHRATLETLRRWAGAEQLFTANFFFWNSGYPMQKSQVGLLQSLLYQVLRTYPALIMEVCPLNSFRRSWKRKELFDALDKVSKQTTLLAKSCFFVDGLDEYEGDDEDIIALLQELASCPSIKICVSSRPWNTFLDAFDDSKWKLVLEDLTRDDMRKYVHTMLIQNQAFSEMSKYDPRCETLVPQIARKAQGVWLWVYLVVRDLLRDLKGEEEYPLLQRRLDSFPDELESYFEDIIDRIDRIHSEETARIFLVAVTAVQPFPLLSLSYLSMEATDKDYAIRMELCGLSIQEAFQIKRKWRKLLNSRCRDLLEVDHITLGGVSSFLDDRVEFLHRTVRDFLRNNYQDELRKRAGDGFDARCSLCKTIVALSKVSVSDSANDGSNVVFPALELVEELVEEMLLYAQSFERTEAQSMARLLDEMNRVYCLRFAPCGLWTVWTEKRRKMPQLWDFPIRDYQEGTFLALVIRAGLRLYVGEKLEVDKVLTTKEDGHPLLDYACRPERYSTIIAQLEQDNDPDPQMVHLLLEHGSDPNQLMGSNYKGHTVWTFFILSCYCRSVRPRESDKAFTGRSSLDRYRAVIELMIDHGASPNETVRIPPSIPLPGRWTCAPLQREVGGPFEAVERDGTEVSIHWALQRIFGDHQAARFAQRMEEVAQRNRPRALYFWRLLRRT